MESVNQTKFPEFLLWGFSEEPELQPVLFGLFLCMYLVTVLGNLLIILAISSDPHPHTPMYSFLPNLSFVDICSITTAVPKMLVNIQTQRIDISYIGCLSQLSFFVFFVCMDNLLLTVMAYDRYMAICHPLHYPVIMNSYLCGLLVLGSCFISLLDSQLHCLMVSQLTFCPEVGIPQFFCDPSELLNLACSDTITKNVPAYCFAAIFGGVPISGILFSYTRIVSSIQRIPSSDGKYKAFSTCSSHLSVVFLFYGTSMADIGFTSATIPKMLLDIHTHHRIISYVDCLIQLSFFLFFGCMDNVLLSVMAYDRFVAICYPLHYPVIMNPYLCALLVLGSCFISLLDSQVHCLMVSQLTFCPEVGIPQFFCDPSVLLNLACSGTITKNVLVYCLAAIFGGVPISVILFSYTRIVSSILRIPSSDGKYKAFST
ncbi:PREDICTED: olfactory receptor 7E24-like, partial [Chrysochloris asiatica]|uniref:Olfactory receptor 7E24-like n=1 Tax=Chrysochloris asiatica TaxID=185453 RepID=A0A9B0U835_CHRAS